MRQSDAARKAAQVIVPEQIEPPAMPEDFWGQIVIRYVKGVPVLLEVTRTMKIEAP